MKTRFVAEVSSNHWTARPLGRAAHLERALAFVDRAAEIGCAAVKFQQFKIDQLFAPVALRVHEKLRKRAAWELPEEFNVALAARAREKGIAFASTPFYHAAVDLLAPHVDFFKIASYQLLWHEILGAVARTGKPVVLATGMANLREVRSAVECLRKNGCADLTLLHCVSVYPTPPEAANLRAIETLRKEFDLPVGWSDHTRSREVIDLAVRRFQAAMVEFHFDIDAQGVESEGGHCWSPGEIAWALRNLEQARAADLPRSHVALGDGRKEPRGIEAQERRWRTDPSDGLRPTLEERQRLARELPEPEAA